MTPRRTVAILLSLALVFCLPHFTQAKYPKGKLSPTPGEGHTVIESVSSDSITVSTTGGGGGANTYKINSFTEITYDGQDTTVNQLQPGMRVTVTPDGADADTAAIVNANAAPTEPTPKPKPK